MFQILIGYIINMRFYVLDTNLEYELFIDITINFKVQIYRYSMYYYFYMIHMLESMCVQAKSIIAYKLVTIYQSLSKHFIESMLINKTAV